MTLKELKIRFLIDLGSLYEEEEAIAIFFIVIDHYFKIKRSTYNFKKEEILSSEDLKQATSVLHLLQLGKPIQYIIAETIFYGLPLKVSEAVLIPRPETEELVEWVLEKSIEIEFEMLNILDVGTGSGCIAISLKKNLPNAHVTALDVSKEALSIAKENAHLNEIDISFIEHDILRDLSCLPNTPYNILISNPPYITQKEKEQMHENVLAYEPHLALFVSDEKPLIFYEIIADFALKSLINNGLLFFEINEYLGKETVNMLISKGFKNIELKKDMQGKDRMICCYTP